MCMHNNVVPAELVALLVKVHPDEHFRFNLIAGTGDEDDDDEDGETGSITAIFSSSPMAVDE